MRDNAGSFRKVDDDPASGPIPQTWSALTLQARLARLQRADVSINRARPISTSEL